MRFRTIEGKIEELIEKMKNRLKEEMPKKGVSGIIVKLKERIKRDSDKLY